VAGGAKSGCKKGINDEREKGERHGRIPMLYLWRTDGVDGGTVESIRAACYPAPRMAALLPHTGVSFAPEANEKWRGFRRGPSPASARHQQSRQRWARRLDAIGAPLASRGWPPLRQPPASPAPAAARPCASRRPPLPAAVHPCVAPPAPRRLPLLESCLTLSGVRKFLGQRKRGGGNARREQAGRKEEGAAAMAAAGVAAAAGG
jgi:hypothetical protein